MACAKLGLSHLLAPSAAENGWRAGGDHRGYRTYLPKLPCPGTSEPRISRHAFSLKGSIYSLATPGIAVENRVLERGACGHLCVPLSCPVCASLVLLFFFLLSFLVFILLILLLLYFLKNHHRDIDTGASGSAVGARATGQETDLLTSVRQELNKISRHVSQELSCQAYLS